MRRLLPLLLAGLAGCLLANSGRDEVVRVFREFNSDLRWGRHEHVLPRLAPALRARFAAQVQALGEDLEFLDQEVLGIDVQRGKRGHDQAQCRVELSWTNRRTGIVERATVLQHWEATGPSWMVKRMVRMRGASLPFFDEPPLPKTPPPDGGAAEPPSEQPQREPQLGDDRGGPW